MCLKIYVLTVPFLRTPQSYFLTFSSCLFLYAKHLPHMHNEFVNMYKQVKAHRHERYLNDANYPALCALDVEKLFWEKKRESWEEQEEKISIVVQNKQGEKKLFFPFSYLKFIRSGASALCESVERWISRGSFWQCVTAANLIKCRREREIAITQNNKIYSRLHLESWCTKCRQKSFGSARRRVGSLVRRFNELCAFMWMCLLIIARRICR